VDHFQLTIVVMAVTGTPWERRDADGRRRAFNAEELDALADFRWHWPDLKGFLATGTNAVRSRWRPRASNSVASLRLPSPPSPSMRARHP
jgi:hypothetical protein